MNFRGFGLAKAIEPVSITAQRTSRDDDFSNAPTLSLAATNAGMIIGTAAYMAPEQARGKVVDQRADIWAFGVVLYEMLTGRRPFEGDGLSDVLAAVLRQPIEWSALPPETPQSIRRLLRRCLEKDCAERLRDMSGARLDIKDALAGSAEPATGETVATLPRG